MKKFLTAVGVVALLTACGGGGDEGEPADETPVEEPAEEAPAEEAPADDAVEEGEGAEGEEAAGDFDATAARETYEKSCIGCHGGNLEGGAGPALTGTGLTAAEIEDIILNGKGAMPPQNVDPADAANLAKWLETQ